MGEEALVLACEPVSIDAGQCTLYDAMSAFDTLRTFDDPKLPIGTLRPQSGIFMDATETALLVKLIFSYSLTRQRTSETVCHTSSPAIWRLSKRWLVFGLVPTYFTPGSRGPCFCAPVFTA